MIAALWLFAYLAAELRILASLSKLQLWQCGALFVASMPWSYGLRSLWEDLGSDLVILISMHLLYLVSYMFVILKGDKQLHLMLSLLWVMAGQLLLWSVPADAFITGALNQILLVLLFAVAALWCAAKNTSWSLQTRYLSLCLVIPCLELI